MIDEMPITRWERQNETLALAGAFLSLNAIAIIISLSVAGVLNEQAISECVSKIAESRKLAVADVLHDTEFSKAVGACKDNAPHTKFLREWDSLLK